MPEFYEIEVMLKGMKQIITHQTMIAETDRIKYFGMLSVFRNREIPLKYEFEMVELEMIFEWYILQEGIEQRNIKLILGCLIFHLESKD